MPEREEARWLPMVGAESYEVSDRGAIRRIRTGRILTARLNFKGYLRASVKSRPTWVHRAVLEAFRGPRPVGMVCAHLNGNPQDNRLENLVWTTREENERHKRLHGTALLGEKNPNARLTVAGVLLARELMAQGHAKRAVARRLGVHVRRIQEIAQGKAWAHV